MLFFKYIFLCWFWLEVVVEALDLIRLLDFFPFLDSSMFGSYFPKSDHAVCELKPRLLTSRWLTRFGRKLAGELFIYFLTSLYTLSSARKVFLKKFKF